MRVGTWNIAGRWDERHLALTEGLDCDVLLLTEVSERVELPAHHLHLGVAVMAAKRRWSAIASRQPARPLPDPHGASAMVEIDGLRFCSSVLPWRSCGSRPPWAGLTSAAKMAAAVDEVLPAAPTVWGGDWNHALTGQERSGSVAGRECILSAITSLGLQVPTAELPHRIDGLLSIDHVAVPEAWVVLRAERHVAVHDGDRLSDHDAYTVEVELAAP